MTPGLSFLRLIGLLVPSRERAAWIREWTAELHYSWHRQGPRHGIRAPGGAPAPRPVSRIAILFRCLGALEDALWLRIRRRNKTMLVQDVKYAIRSFARSPGFTAVTVLTLALGIGANTAIFTLVDAVLLRPLPVHEPSQLTDIYTSCRRGFPYCSTSYPDFVDYRDRNRSFADMAAFAGMTVSLQDGDAVELMGAMLVTGNYFGLLGVNAVLGRTIIPDDDRLGDAKAVIVLSHRMWMNEFAGDEDVIGRDFRLNRAPYTVIGVAPKGFRGTRLNQSPDMWIPFSSLPLIDTRNPPFDVLPERGFRWIGGTIGRRLPGVTVAQARADMLSVSDRLAEETNRAGRTITTEATRTFTLPAATTGRDIVRFATLLMVVVGAVLLITCANIANLLLARASARRREIGVRIALGAGRARLVRQLLTESVILSVTGAAAALFVASVGLKFLSGYALPGFVSIASLELALDGRVLAFTAMIAVVTGVLFGLVPALQTTTPNLSDALRQQSSDARSRGIMRTRGILLSFQTAMALVLLIGAGLFVRSLKNGLNADVGFTTRNLAMASFDLSLLQYSQPAVSRFLRDLTVRSIGVPGAREVTTSVYPPLAGSGSGFFINIPGHIPAAGEEMRIEANWVGPRYFRTLGIPLINGRDFTEQDMAGAPIVAVINETMARRWWPGEDPVGRTFRLNSDGSGPEALIVGLAQDVTYGLADAPEPFIYYPIHQFMDRAAGGSIQLLVSTNDAPVNTLPLLRNHLRELEPNLAIPELTTLESRFEEFLMPQRMGTMLLSSLGGLTVLLAVVGISGVVGYAVNQRRKEIGIRITLGAARRHVLGVMVRGAVIPVAVGLAVGLMAAASVTRFITNFMFNVRATDPVTFLVVPAIMAIVAIVAAYFPARRATRINPTEALRAE
ncbi:MAG: ABC transporter permease [Gemmatimonadetes bacterium]|nr:ABC transporter permease [Gemmatimonadota bacterium]